MFNITNNNTLGGADLDARGVGHRAGGLRGRGRMARHPVLGRVQELLGRGVGVGRGSGLSSYSNKKFMILIITISNHMLIV